MELDGTNEKGVLICRERAERYVVLLAASLRRNESNIPENGKRDRRGLPWHHQEDGR